MASECGWRVLTMAHRSTSGACGERAPRGEALAPVGRSLVARVVRPTARRREARPGRQLRGGDAAARATTATRRLVHCPLHPPHIADRRQILAIIHHCVEVVCGRLRLGVRVGPATHRQGRAHHASGPQVRGSRVCGDAGADDQPRHSLQVAPTLHAARMGEMWRRERHEHGP